MRLGVWCLTPAQVVSGSRGRRLCEVGSFNQNCAISNLPITPGTPVRYFLLVETKVGTPALYPTDWYAPRTFPLRGVYEDYGDLRDVQAGPQREIWIEGLARDVVEHGTGDNPCHDKAVYRDTLTFDALADLIHEGVLYVEREPSPARPSRRACSTGPGRSGEPERFCDPYPGVPTLLAVRHLLLSAGFSVVENWDNRGYLLNEVQHGDVTVRWSQVSDHETVAAEIEKIRPMLEGLYTVVVLDDNARHPALRLFPKPGTENWFGFRGGSHSRRWADEAKSRVAVSKAFVREDVWQALISMSLDRGFGYDQKTGKLTRHPKATIDTYVAYAREVYAAYTAHMKARAEAEAEAARNPDRATARRWMGDFFANFGGDAIGDNPVMWLLCKQGEGGCSGVSLQDHFELFCARNPPVEEVDAFLRVVAEMAMVRSVLCTVGQLWLPSRPFGQDTAEEEHAELRLRLAEIAVAQRDDRRARRTAWDGADEADDS